MSYDKDLLILCQRVNSLEINSEDQNGMPEKLLVVPAYGVDFSYVYEYTGKTTGPEW